MADTNTNTLTATYDFSEGSGNCSRKTNGILFCGDFSYAKINKGDSKQEKAKKETFQGKTRLLKIKVLEHERVCSDVTCALE